jgi:hypothetical protein
MRNGTSPDEPRNKVGQHPLFGLPVIFGDRRAPTSAYIQVPGSGLPLQRDVLSIEIDRSSTMRRVMLHYAHAFSIKSRNQQHAINSIPSSSGVAAGY